VRSALLFIANPRLLLQRDWAEGWGAPLSHLGRLGGLKPKALLVADFLLWSPRPS